MKKNKLILSLISLLVAGCAGKVGPLTVYRNYVHIYDESRDYKKIRDYVSAGFLQRAKIESVKDDIHTPGDPKNIRTHSFLCDQQSYDSAVCIRKITINGRNGYIEGFLVKTGGNWILDKEEKFISIPDSYLESEANIIKRENRFGLAELRRGVSIFYGEMEGAYPKDLSDLVPSYLSDIPFLWNGDNQESPHKKMNTVINYSNREFKDTGGWAYISNKKDRYFGRVFIDCTHLDSKGRPWSSW